MNAFTIVVVIMYSFLWLKSVLGRGMKEACGDVQIPLSALEEKYFFPFCWLVMLLRGILVGPEHTCLSFDVDPVPCSVWGGLFAP